MLSSHLEIIEQGKGYLDNVSKEDYTSIISPNFVSSAGSHIRHILDHYDAIILGLKNELIDYDKRERGSQVELSPELAIAKFNEIVHWLKSLTAETLNRQITLATEVSVTHKDIQKVLTTVARELIFASSHAVHHYAMIAQISFAQEKVLAQTFGLAPATATFNRECAEKSTKTLLSPAL